MPLTRADRQQIDEYIQNNQPHLARLVLEDHLKQEPFDEPARKALAKINTRYPLPPALVKATSAAKATAPTQPDAIKRTATNLETVSPARVAMPAALKLDDDDEIMSIKKAFLEKRYEDARAMLIVSDHPDAEKYRQRLKDMGGVGGDKMKRDDSLPDMTGKLTITVLLLLTLTLFGLVTLTIWLPEAKRYPDAPGAGGLILTNKVVTYILQGILIIILLFFALLVVSYILRPRY